MPFAEIFCGRADKIRANLRILAVQGFRMTVPLNDEASRLLGFGIAKEQSHQLIVFDVWLSAVVKQFRRLRGAKRDINFCHGIIGGADRFDNLFLDVLHVLRVHAAREWIRSPQTQGVRPLVIVRAAH